MDAVSTRKRIDELVTKAQDEILASSRELADAITKETGKNVPPIGDELTRIIDEVFDFAQGVIEGQRRMVSEVLATLSDTLEEASVRTAPKARATKKAPAKKSSAKKAPAKKAPAKKASAKKAPAKKAGAARR